ncbi:hypothetical protein LWC34_26095 [Kibdelosporangium philippinense]|uniref:Uncharacterized protein n=1 Tax=Kibdelosporangium philippinense TaxID=211113 RepID=A0ABS8ZEN4_9PSEU|nr:hypothetical protein [Kibdelosporangium philippinense]MCE7006285.1 hypothetical protein [Kibdelosporangium philippinense]
MTDRPGPFGWLRGPAGLAGVIFRVSAPPARRVKLLDSPPAWLLATVRRSRVQHAMPERQTRAGTRH